MLARLLSRSSGHALFAIAAVRSATIRLISSSTGRISKGGYLLLYRLG
jgi:hypothetical protein